MRVIERKKARDLRAAGYSLREIAERIHCSKSSISEWVRDIPLTADQIERLHTKQDRARAKAANHPRSPKNVWAGIRRDIEDAAAKDIPETCSISTLKIIGSSLYWAEGHKASLNVVNFSNSDPNMIELMMRFFREVCKVPEEKFRGMLHIHPHLDTQKAIAFWSIISKIPVSQFHKTQYGISKAGKQKRDTFPLGTFRIVVSDTRLLTRIKGWIQGLKSWTNLRALSSVG